MKAMRYLPALALAMAASGCGPGPVDTNPEGVFSANPAAAPGVPAAVECPWVESESARAAVVLTGAATTPPPVAKFVPGCAIIRFTVAEDGRVSHAALRAVAPLNDGPTALAALQQMRFQPARSPDTHFVVRLSMRRDDAGHVFITSETRHVSAHFWDWM